MKKAGPNGHALWAFMQKFEVPDYDNPDINYLTRWRIIQTPWFGIYLHKLGGPDPRPTLHDHPWPFVSFVLRGGYVEHTPARDWPWLYAKPRHVARINCKRSTGLHWIQRLDRTPTWTLMLVGRRHRTWGYLDRDGEWTAFDKHPYNEEFKLALERRSGSRGTTDG